MNGKKTRDTNLKKYGKDYYSRISRKRKTFSGGQTFRDPEVARAAQLKAAATRKRNNELKREANNTRANAPEEK